MSFTYHCAACGRVHINSGPCAAQTGTATATTTETIVVTTEGIFGVHPRRRPDDDDGTAGVPARIR